MSAGLSTSAPVLPVIAPPERDAQAPVASLVDVSLRYGKVEALADITLEIPAGRMVGLLGPDGVGKSSLLALLAGARAVQQGRVHALAGDMGSRRHRRRACPHIAYMPQGLGKNLYPTLSVEKNLQFFGRLFGHQAAERHRRIDDLTRDTGLTPFLARPAGKLSGGMKQKLALCCALIHDPDLLILDEPTTGVDSLARAQFWGLIARIRTGRPGMSVIVATAYMDEAQRFDWPSRTRPASPATRRAGIRCRSAPGWTAPCRCGPRPCAAMCRACIWAGCWTRRGSGSVSTQRSARR